MSTKNWMKANVSTVEIICIILTLLVSLSMLFEIYILTNTESVFVVIFAVIILFIKIYVFMVGCQIVIKLNKNYGELHAITILILFVSIVVIFMMPLIWSGRI
jgi:hypothetical protein